jgi:methionine salvage enolase-phosphatase E1
MVSEEINKLKLIKVIKANEDLEYFDFDLKDLHEEGVSEDDLLTFIQSIQEPIFSDEGTSSGEVNNPRYPIGVNFIRRAKDMEICVLNCCLNLLRAFILDSSENANLIGMLSGPS